MNTRTADLTYAMLNFPVCHNIPFPSSPTPEKIYLEAVVWLCPLSLLCSTDDQQEKKLMAWIYCNNKLKFFLLGIFNCASNADFRLGYFCLRILYLSSHESSRPNCSAQPEKWFGPSALGPWKHGEMPRKKPCTCFVLSKSDVLFIGW